MDSEKIPSAFFKAVAFLISAKLALSGLAFAKDLPYKIKDPYNICAAADATVPYSRDEYVQTIDSRIESGVWTLTSPDRRTEVTLIGMAHYAEPKFFEAVNGILDQSDYVIVEGLTEGLSPRNKRHPMNNALNVHLEIGSLVFQADYLTPYENSNLAAAQSADIQPAPAKFIYPDANMNQLIEGQWRLDNYLYWLNASINRDITLFLYTGNTEGNITIEAESSGESGGISRNSQDLSDFAKAITDWKGDYSDQVFICYRDDLVMASLTRLLGKIPATDSPARIAIPWGVAHIPDLLRRLEERDYTVTAHDYLAILSGR